MAANAGPGGGPPGGQPPASAPGAAGAPPNVGAPQGGPGQGMPQGGPAGRGRGMPMQSHPNMMQQQGQMQGHNPYAQQVRHERPAA